MVAEGYFRLATGITIWTWDLGWSREWRSGFKTPGGEGAEGIGNVHRLLEDSIGFQTGSSKP